MNLADELNSINDLETQFATFETLAGQLAVADHDPATVAAVLGVFERCGHMEDFGVFGTLANYLEAADPDVVGPLVVASVRRAPCWKTIEILPGFVDAADARAVLEHVQMAGLLKDERFDDEWLASQLDELAD